MRKDIKIGFTGTLISVFLFALGLFITNNSFFETFLQEKPIAIQSVLVFLVFLCQIVGFLGMITFIPATITLICLEHHSKKVNRYKNEIKSKLPKETKFDVNIATQNNGDLDKLLCTKLKCTALFNGNTVYIEFSLPEKVVIETDDLIWFDENFRF